MPTSASPMSSLSSRRRSARLDRSRPTRTQSRRNLRAPSGGHLLLFSPKENRHEPTQHFHFGYNGWIGARPVAERSRRPATQPQGPAGRNMDDRLVGEYRPQRREAADRESKRIPHLRFRRAIRTSDRPQ